MLVYYHDTKRRYFTNLKIFKYQFNNEDTDIRKFFNYLNKYGTVKRTEPSYVLLFSYI